MKGRFTDIEADLTKEDLAVLLKDIRMANKMLYVMLGVNLVLAMAFMIFYPHPVALIISVIMAIVICVLIFMIQKRSGALSQGKKRIITGVISDMQIDFPASTVEYKIDRKEEVVHLKIKKPGGFEERTEPLVLSAGAKDDFFYYIFFDQGRLNVAREIFFTFTPGNTAQIEIAPSGYILSYRVKQ